MDSADAKQACKLGVSSRARYKWSDMAVTWGAFKWPKINGRNWGEMSPLYTLPETNCLPLKMDGWNTTFLLGFGLFSGAFAVSFREGKWSDMGPYSGTHLVGLLCGIFLFLNHIPPPSPWRNDAVS